MSLVNRMYSSKKSPDGNTSEKNPNKVSGGLKAQHADRFSIIDESGKEQELPSYKYIAALESQLKKQRAATQALEHKVSRLEEDIRMLGATVRSRSS